MDQAREGFKNLVVRVGSFLSVFFFFNDTATPEIYTLSLHDALPIWLQHPRGGFGNFGRHHRKGPHPDRKSTRLNSSHLVISYAVFCLKKKQKNQDRVQPSLVDLPVVPAATAGVRV